MNMLTSCGHWGLVTWICKVLIHENMFPQAGYKTFSSLSGSSVNMLMSCGHWVCVEMLCLFWPCCAFRENTVAMQLLCLYGTCCALGRPLVPAILMRCSQHHLKIQNTVCIVFQCFSSSSTVVVVVVVVVPMLGILDTDLVAMAQGRLSTFNALRDGRLSIRGSHVSMCGNGLWF